MSLFALRNWLLLLPLASLLTVNAALSIKSSKFSVVSESTVLRSSEINPSLPLESVKLSDTEILKLAFTIVDDHDNPVQPHQVFLRFWDRKNGEEGIQPVRVGQNGKAKFELNMRRPVASIPPTTGSDPLEVTLILGSFEHESATIPLISLTLPASRPVSPHPDAHHYHAKPLIAHTFRPDQTHPPKVLSATFAALAFAPWALLAKLLSSQSIGFTPSSRTIPFLALLATFEGLLFWYWVDLRLGQVLMYGAGLAVLTTAAGKRALSG